MSSNSPAQCPSEEKLTFRVKCKLSQNMTVRDVSSLMTVEDFLKDLSNLTSVPYNRMALLKGFPPRRIPYAGSMTLGSLGLLHQDTIIVELDMTGRPGFVHPDQLVQPAQGSFSTWLKFSIPHAIVILKKTPIVILTHSHPQTHCHPQ